MQSLIGLNTKELEQVAKEMGQPAYRGKQLAEWIYKRGAETFDAMGNLPREFRVKLAGICDVGTLDVAHRDESADETVKYVLSLKDGRRLKAFICRMPSGFPSAFPRRSGARRDAHFARRRRAGFRAI